MKVNEKELIYRELITGKVDHLLLTVAEVAQVTGFSQRECTTKLNGWQGNTSGRRMSVVQLAKELTRLDT